MVSRADFRITRVLCECLEKCERDLLCFVSACKEKSRLWPLDGVNQRGGDGNEARQLKAVFCFSPSVPHVNIAMSQQ